MASETNISKNYSNYINCKQPINETSRVLKGKYKYQFSLLIVTYGNLGLSYYDNNVAVGKFRSNDIHDG